MSDVSLQGSFGQDGAPIVESGSNANGSYIKYADGTMVCVKREVINLATNTAQGALYRSADVTARSYPVAFTELQYSNVSVECPNNLYGWVASIGESTLTSWQAVAVLDTATATARDYNFNFLAIGRWK